VVGVSFPKALRSASVQVRWLRAFSFLIRWKGKMNWKKILAKEWLIVSGCVGAGLILILVVSIILVANNEQVDSGIYAVLLLPFLLVYVSRLVFLFKNSITWAIKTVKDDKSKPSAMADATIIDAPSLIKAKAVKKTRFKNSAVIGLILGCIVIALLYQIRPSDIAAPHPSPTTEPEHQTPEVPSSPPSRELSDAEVFGAQTQLPDFATLKPVASKSKPISFDEADRIAAPLLNRSLPNGTIIQNFIASGNGKLTVENGTSSDVKVRLKSISESYIFFAQANHDVVVESVPDGNYQVLYEAGEDWDDISKDFTRDQSFFEFNDFLNFQTTETPEADGTNEQTTIYTLTLHPVLNGNAGKHPINKSDFMR
jgi:hypothetical protein